MYFFVKNIEKTIILPPQSLGPKIENFIIQKLIQSVEGKCHPQYGWIIAVYNIVEHGEGLISETADVIFRVKYNAVTFKPLASEVLDGLVVKVHNYGINVSVGPMITFISQDNIPSDYNYKEIPEPSFINDQFKYILNIEQNKILKLDFEQKIMIQKEMSQQFYQFQYAIGTIADDYLGVLD